MTADQWGQLAERYGLTAIVLALLIIGSMRGWIVWKEHHREVVTTIATERDMWREEARVWREQSNSTQAALREVSSLLRGSRT